MYLVRADDQPTMESGPFETHEEASRFAIGLAKTGQASKVEIFDQDVLSAAQLLHGRVVKMHNSCSIDKYEPLVNAMDHLAGAILNLYRYYDDRADNDKPIPYTVSEDVERRR